VIIRAGDDHRMLSPVTSNSCHFHRKLATRWDSRNAIFITFVIQAASPFQHHRIHVFASHSFPRISNGLANKSIDSLFLIGISVSSQGQAPISASLRIMTPFGLLHNIFCIQPASSRTVGAVYFSRSSDLQFRSPYKYSLYLPP